ncbi:Platinum sensitivity protein [Modicella reniformis]|uniref:Platinum sensitivity protein n=1 Tax=Modicella reniformis TaxID=1440133 RepID=A0A9P6SUQ4_9FUNG|nr:Platinum sensitivity protein [Modicella reniformis]
MDPLAKMRVKVYKLSTGQWIDQGTGHCSCEFNQDKSEGTLIVHSEDEEDKVLLRTRIRVGEELYQRQQATLIIWSEDDGEDLALSFQEADGCGEIWDNINEVQQHYAEDLFSDPSDANGAGGNEIMTLPDPDISNLAEIENLIKEAQNGTNEKEKLAAFIILDNYIDKLFPILETCEDLDSRSDLHILHGIMLGIIMLNDIAIMQYILKDEVIGGCLGMLEYDPVFGDQKEDYREFLSKRAKFKQIIPINNVDIEQKIHQAYRLHFLRDTVLARVVDESLSSILGSLIFFLNMDIVTHISSQAEDFLRQLLGILENESEALERKRDVVLFVQQFCAMGKTTQLVIRLGLYRQAEEKPQKQLMGIILDQFLQEEEMGIKLQYAEVIRTLLNTNTTQNDSLIPAALEPMPNLDPDADKFLELFYGPGPYVEKFMSPLIDLSEGALRFFRTCIGLNDEFYHRYLIKQGIFQHIVDTLLSTNNKNNLLNSACIEFFDFIRNENIKSLISHIVPLYGDKLKKIEYVNTFKGLVRRYEQHQDTSVADAEAAEAAASETSSIRRGPAQKAWSSSTVDDDEEAYFNNSDEEDEVPNEGKQEDDPPTSDLRRRVKDESDEESEQDEQETPQQAHTLMDRDTEPVLASQTLPPPPSLLRRRLVDYGEDEDEDEDEGAFHRKKPPEKKIRLDPEESENSEPQDQVMEEASESQKMQGAQGSEGSGHPIKFKLNSLRNGRSPSPLSPNSRSRSVSPLSSNSGLPPVVTRTGIAFVKAGSTDSNSSQSSEDESKAGSPEDKDVISETAIHLRSDLALGFMSSTDEDENGRSNGELLQPDCDLSESGGSSGSNGSSGSSGSSEHVAVDTDDVAKPAEANAIEPEETAQENVHNVDAESEDHAG